MEIQQEQQMCVNSSTPKSKTTHHVKLFVEPFPSRSSLNGPWRNDKFDSRSSVHHSWIKFDSKEMKQSQIFGGNQKALWSKQILVFFIKLVKNHQAQQTRADSSTIKAEDHQPHEAHRGSVSFKTKPLSVSFKTKPLWPLKKLVAQSRPSLYGPRRNFQPNSRSSLDGPWIDVYIDGLQSIVVKYIHYASDFKTVEIVLNIASSGIYMVTLAYWVSIRLHAIKHVMIRYDNDVW